MPNWSQVRTYRKVAAFVGRKSMIYLGMGVLTGVLLFLIELMFAYVLQAFLVIMKVVPAKESMQIPRWLPIDRPSTFLLVVSGVLLLRGLAHWSHNYLLSWTSETQKDHQRYRVINWALSSRTVNTAEVLHLYNHGIAAVCETLVNIQNIAIMASTAILMFCYLNRISWRMTTLSVVILAGIAGVMRYLDMVISRKGLQANSNLELVNRGLIANIKNLLLLQIYGVAEDEKARIRGALDKVIRANLEYFRIHHLKAYLPQTLGVMLICGLCIESTERQWIAPAMVVTYFYLFLKFVQGFADVSKLTSGISFLMPATSSFAQWWATHSLDGVNRQPVKEFIPGFRIDSPPGWRMANLSFRYSSGERLVLRDFSLEIAPGSCVVLTGPSGGGKSTILALALGLVEPTTGVVEIVRADAGPTRIEQAREGLLRSVGYVGPESFLVDGTIRDNLFYGLRSAASDDDIQRALAEADCGFVFELKEGLDHRISDQGHGLSAGQKQRLSFARALLRQPLVLILDEATANLDSESERRLVAALSRRKGATTILAVTHRDALLSIADRVVKLGEDGRA
jgi:ABC-type multidrug transport system fused ATPase/permease subunit